MWCGTDVGGVTTFVGLSATTSVTIYNPRNIFSMGTSVTGGTSGLLYQICWSYAPVLNTHFSYRVGDFTLNGPTTLDSLCFLTVSCAVQLGGVGFAVTNRVKVQSSAEVCSLGIEVRVSCRYFGSVLLPQKEKKKTMSDFREFPFL